jgi:anti-anti-sigma factor
MGAYQYLQVAKQADVFVVRFVDEQLVGNLPTDVAEELYALAAQDDCKSILVNLSGVDIMSSEMYGRLISLNRRMEQKEGRLKLCEVSPKVREVLETTRLDQIFDVRETEAAGLAAFG